MVTKEEIIKELEAQGLNILPLKPESKEPDVSSWTIYQHTKCTIPIRQNQNFAVIGGSISNGLLIVDIDTNVDLESLNKIYPDVLNNTLVVKSGMKGYHLYFFIDTIAPNLKHIEFHNMIIDTKGEGGYVVGAGSIHPDTKKEYQIISNTLKIKSIKSHELGFELEKKKSLSLSEIDRIKTGRVKQGERNNSALSLANHYFAKGYSYEMVSRKMEEWNKIIDGGSLPAEEIQQVIENAERFVADNPPKKSMSKQDTREIADELLKMFHLATLTDTKEILMYEEGVYVSNKEWKLEEECEKMLEHPTSGIVSEVLDTIRRRTFTERTEFDKNPNIINLKNGFFKIEQMLFHEHTPEYLSRVQLDVEYDENAQCPNFEKFLSECLPEEEDYQNALEAAALTLLKTSCYEIAFMFIGSGANGKSTFLKVLESILGKNNVSNVSIHDISDNPFMRAELDGKLANIYSDIEASELKNLGVLKMIISGDSIVVSRKHQQPFKMESFTKLIFSANKFPKINDHTLAFFRRFMLIEWNQSFLNNPDRNLIDKLLAERVGIFNLLAKTAKRIIDNKGLTYLKDPAKLKEMWEELSEPTYKYFNEKTVYSEGDDLERTVLYANYKKFCEDKKISPINPTRFLKFLKENDYEIQRTRRGDSQVEVIKNIKFRTEEKIDR